jgi:AcrR family transcriptional regulator
VRTVPSAPHRRPGPAGGPRDRNRQAQRRRLGEAALALFLARGTAAVTVDDIVRRARMAKGSFYRYAIDKADLVSQIMDPVIAEASAAIDRCEGALRIAKREAIGAIYLTLAHELSAVVGAHAGRVLLYLQEARAPQSTSPPAISELADRVRSRAVALTRIAREHGLIRPVDPEIAGLAVLGAIDAILFAYLRQRRAPAAEVSRVTVELVEIVLRGIRA